MKLTAYAPAASLNASPNASSAASSLREKHTQIERQKLEAQKQALTTLKQHTESRKDDAKALAKKRVDQLKERLKMLEQMPSLDPAKKARLIAQLTKELKSAVKAYGAAGGTSSEAGMGAGTTPSTAVSSGQAPSETAETPPPTEDSPSDSGENEPRDPARTTAYDSAASRQTDERKSLEAEEDAAFARDVRDMMRKIKAQLDKAKAEATRDNASEDIKDAEAALSALDEELGAIESSAAATGLTSGLMLSLSV